MVINDGYMTHQPAFSDELNVTQEVRDACEGNPACIHDSVVTGNVEIGLSTLRISSANDQILQTLG